MFVNLVSLSLGVGEDHFTLFQNEVLKYDLHTNKTYRCSFINNAVLTTV